MKWLLWCHSTAMTELIEAWKPPTASKDVESHSAISVLLFFCYNWAHEQSKQPHKRRQTTNTEPPSGAMLTNICFEIVFGWNSKTHKWTTSCCSNDPLTDHGGLYKAPGVGLRDVRLQNTSWASGLVHSTEYVDLPSAYGGSCRMNRLGQRRHRLPLICDGVVPEGNRRDTFVNIADICIVLAPTDISHNVS